MGLGEQGEEISISLLLLLWVEPFEHSVLAYPEDLCADGHSWNYGFATSVMPQDVQIPFLPSQKLSTLTSCSMLCKQIDAVSLSLISKSKEFLCMLSAWCP